jgi:hypothetical protein
VRSEFDEEPFETVELAPSRAPSLRSPLVLVVLGTAALLTVVVLSTQATGCDRDAFAPGSGDGATPGSPLLVHDAAALDAVGGCLGRHHLQVADIVPSAPFVPLGLGQGDGALTGSYDGGGHAIVDLRVFLPGASDVALFSHIDGGEVRDLTLERPRIEGGAGVAALAGRVTGAATLERIRVIDADIIAEDAAATVAGSAGREVRIEVTLRAGSVRVDAGKQVASVVGQLLPADPSASTRSAALPDLTVTTAGPPPSLADATGPVPDRSIGSES